MTDRTRDQAAADLKNILAQGVNVAAGSSAGGSVGSTVSASLTNPVNGQIQTVSGIALTPLPPGNISAFKDKDDQWYLASPQAANRQRSTVTENRHGKPIPEGKGQIKFLVSEQKSGKLSFYVMGWSKRTTLVREFPTTTTVVFASIDNLGGDRWAVDLGYSEPGGNLKFERIVRGTSTIVTLPVQIALNSKPVLSMGFGYVINNSYGGTTTLTPIAGGYEETTTGRQRYSVWQGEFSISGQGNIVASSVEESLETVVVQSAAADQNWTLPGKSIGTHENTKITRSRITGADLETEVDTDILDFRRLHSSGTKGLGQRERRLGQQILGQPSGIQVTREWAWFDGDDLTYSPVLPESLEAYFGGNLLDVQPSGFTFIRYASNIPLPVKATIQVDFFTTAGVKKSSKNIKVVGSNRSWVDFRIWSASFRAL